MRKILKPDSFNSSMVRLRALPNSISGVSTKFQFQHGTIKSVIKQNPVVLLLMFQFQHGTIKSGSGAEQEY